jgi:hypothetical protein
LLFIIWINIVHLCLKPFCNGHINHDWLVPLHHFA